jgi:hypothetical protein
VRLRPRLVVDVAIRVGLDLVQPLDVDVRPVARDGARAARASPARRLEGFVGDLELALGEREPERLATRRGVVEVALRRERNALIDGSAHCRSSDGISTSKRAGAERCRVGLVDSAALDSISTAVAAPEAEGI